MYVQRMISKAVWLSQDSCPVFVYGFSFSVIVVSVQLISFEEK